MRAEGSAGGLLPAADRAGGGVTGEMGGAESGSVSLSAATATLGGAAQPCAPSGDVHIGLGPGAAAVASADAAVAPQSPKHDVAVGSGMPSRPAARWCDARLGVTSLDGTGSIVAQPTALAGLAAAAAVRSPAGRQRRTYARDPK
eukprot:SAG11_NODE_4218_length_2006_cov_2.433141_1_plen_145_part_00